MTGKIATTLCSFAALAACLVVGCTAAPNGGPNPVVDMKGAAGTCAMGDTKPCNCTGYAMPGMRTCDANGTFGACTGCKMTDPNAGPTNTCSGCKGCCSMGTCVPLASETAAQCGAMGATCKACTSPATCNTATGKCVTAGGTTGNCAGCLDDQVPPNCIAPADTWSGQCGANGVACMTCPVDGGLCQNGMCTDLIDPNDTYYISFRVIDLTNATGYFCSDETPPSGPDGFACVRAMDTDGTTVRGCSNVCPKTLVCNLDEATGTARTSSSDDPVTDVNIDPVAVPGSALINGTVTINIYDQDPTIDDHLGSGTLPPMTHLPGPTTFVTSGPYTSFPCEAGVTVKVEIYY